MIGWFLYSSFWVGLCAAGLTVSAYLSLGVGVDWVYVAFTTCGTHFIYTLDRQLTRLSPEDAVNRRGAILWQRSHRLALNVTLLLSSGTGLGLFFFLTDSQRWGVGAIALLSLLYVLPVGELMTGRGAAGSAVRIKSLGRLKPIFLGLVWAAGTSLLPLWEQVRTGVATPALVLVGSRACLLVANAVMFDVLDYPGDARSGIRTVAVRRGRRGAWQRALFWSGAACVFAVAGMAWAPGHRLQLGLDLLVAFVFGLVLLHHRGLRRSSLGRFAAQLYDGLLLGYLLVHLGSLA